MQNHTANLRRLNQVARALGQLNNQIVFVGGATVSLFAKDLAETEDVRPTEDVDAIIELASYGGFVKVQEALLAQGFQLDSSSTIIGRYRLGNLSVDIIPTEPHILGFSNPWYPAGLRHSREILLETGLAIRVLCYPYMLATKFVALFSRGGDDFRTSHDFEDIAYLICYGDEGEPGSADPTVNEYLKQVFPALTTRANLEEEVESQFNSSRNSALRARVIERIFRWAEIHNS